MTNKSNLFFALVLFANALSSCAQKKHTGSNSGTINAVVKDSAKTKIKRDTAFNHGYKGLKVPVTLKYAETSKAQILVLPGWNYSDTEWCSKTKLCVLAKERKYDLLFVEMQRSVYLKEYFSETRQDYKKYPTRTWLIDSVVKPLFKTSAFDSSKPIFVMGLSTGGRGAAILALENSNLFDGAATLSGDFDPEYQKDDQLMINSLGSYSKFPQRWKGDDNIVRRISELKVPLFIGHGKNDKVCPIAQSIRLADIIKKEIPGLKIQTHFVENMGHNYLYWNSEVPFVLNFFDDIVKEKRK